MTKDKTNEKDSEQQRDAEKQKRSRKKEMESTQQTSICSCTLHRHIKHIVQTISIQPCVNHSLCSVLISKKFIPFYFIPFHFHLCISIQSNCFPWKILSFRRCDEFVIPKTYTCCVIRIRATSFKHFVCDCDKMIMNRWIVSTRQQCATIQYSTN